ncbi:MAG: helix-turn-helix domain-containing protein [Erysipelotrichaceae bacterium]|nr:helix-turn-helix domain-containing protein [Erysipelotrichaceae bacterium]MDY5252864.1 helix-turn-helix domain-containing protein [Erysipelotrichaceae bacterium]
MDTKKIGRFIAEARKNKNWTQAQLAQKLGVTSKTISRWENGNYMPDISLLLPLSELLEVSLNELLSGEKLSTNDQDKQLEHNLVATLAYSTKTLLKQQKIMAWLLFGWGNVMILAGLRMNAGYKGLFSIIGILLVVLGIYKMLKIKKRWVKFTISSLCFMVILVSLMGVDLVQVMMYQQAPVYAYKVIKSDHIAYYNPFYQVYQLNPNSDKEYWVIDVSKQYDETSIPRTPFDRDISGIANLKKYRFPYVGNNSNTGNLLQALPLSEYGLVFKIDDKANGLVVDYHISDWYINEDGYVDKSLVYNSLCLFGLIDNLAYWQINFSGTSYQPVSRKQVLQAFPALEEIFAQDTIDEAAFNDKIEAMLNDEATISMLYETLFVKDGQ